MAHRGSWRAQDVSRRYHSPMSMPEANDAEPRWLGVAIIVAITIGLTIQAAGGWPWIASWLSSPNAASWVQAFGAIIAIFASTLIVGRQIRDARRLAAQTVLRERQYQQLLAWEAFLALAQRATVACGVVNLQLSNRTEIHSLATSGDLDYGQIDVVSRWLDRIDPLQTPATLVRNGLELAVAVGNFRVLVERCMANHRSMDASAFDDWFRKARMEVTSALNVVQ